MARNKAVNPEKTQAVLARLPEDLHKTLKAKADSQRISLAEAMRRAVEAWTAAEGPFREIELNRQIGEILGVGDLMASKLRHSKVIGELVITETHRPLNGLAAEDLETGTKDIVCPHCQAPALDEARQKGVEGTDGLLGWSCRSCKLAFRLINTRFMPTTNECSAAPVEPSTFPKFKLIRGWQGKRLNEIYLMGYIKIDPLTNKESEPVYAQ